MKKNTFKIIILVILFVFVLLAKTQYVDAYSVSNIFTDAEDFINSGNTVGSMISQSALKDTSTFIYQILFSIGVVVAIAVGIVLGIQFMVSSAMDKAKVKESLIGYVISCVVLFGAYGIWKMVINIVSETTTIGQDTQGFCEHEYLQEPECTNSPQKCQKCEYLCYVEHKTVGVAKDCQTNVKCISCGNFFPGPHNFDETGKCTVPGCGQKYDNDENQESGTKD